LESIGGELQQGAGEAPKCPRHDERNSRFVVMDESLREDKLLLAARSVSAAADQNGCWFVVSDWPSANLLGYAMCDRTHHVASIRFCGRELRRKVLQYRGTFRSEPANAIGCLLISLGLLDRNSACIAPATYADIGRVCFNDLTDGLVLRDE
jgi:hypothetical protein